MQRFGHVAAAVPLPLVAFRRQRYSERSTVENAYIRTTSKMTPTMLGALSFLAVLCRFANLVHVVDVVGVRVRYHVWVGHVRQRGGCSSVARLRRATASMRRR